MNDFRKSEHLTFIFCVMDLELDVILLAYRKKSGTFFGLNKMQLISNMFIVNDFVENYIYTVLERLIIIC